MNKKIFYIFLGVFTSIFILLFIISNNINTKYKTVTINNVSIKGDTTRYKVNFVEKVDGDTIVVRFNKKDLKVRYLLIDTPETVKKGVDVQKYGPEASNLNGEILSKAKNVEIEFDIYEKEDKSLESPEDAKETQEVHEPTSKETEESHGGDEASKEIKASARTPNKTQFFCLYVSIFPPYIIFSLSQLIYKLSMHLTQGICY